MSPLPRKDQLGQYALKGLHLGLRQAKLAPEQVVARQLRRQATALGPRTGKRVAIFSPRDWASHVQWEAIVGQALRVRGAQTTFITCGGGLEQCDRVNIYEGPPMPCATCSRYVEGSVDSHGFPRVRLRDGWAVNDPGDWPDLDAMSLDELFEIDYEGLPLGSLVSVPVRWFLLASRIEDDPLAALTARRFLRSARRVVRGLNATLDDIDPDVVLMLNGRFFFESIANAICRSRGIDVVIYERGFILDTLIFHRRRPDLLLDVADDRPEWDQKPLSSEDSEELDLYLKDRSLGARTLDRYWTGAEFVDPQRPADGRLAVLFTNLTWDSAVLGKEVAFPGIHEWLFAAVDTFAHRPKDQLLIRVHPAEVKLPGRRTREPLGASLLQHYGDLPSNVRIVNADDPLSSYPLMAAADVGLVYTSTTGLEMALRGKPVIVAGRTHYRAKGFTLDASSPIEFKDMLTRALDDPAAVAPDLDRARRYAHLFFFQAPVEAPGVKEHVPGLARLTVRSLNELSPGQSAAVDRICNEILCGDTAGARTTPSQAP
jgi:hypothetical protein